MRIAYCTNVRLPNERAHGHQVAKVTQALTELGHEVEIFAPFRKNPIEENFSAYYGLKHAVALKQLGSVDGIAAWWAPGLLGLKLTTWLFGRELRKALFGRSREFDFIYTRTPELLPFLRDVGIPVILELHRIPRLRTSAFLRSLTSTKLVVALTNGMRMALIDMGVANVPVIAEGDAVDLRDFESLPPPAETRKALLIPDGVPLIGYAGQLESMGLSKGIPELLDGLLKLHERGMTFHAVIAGGPRDVQRKFESGLPDELRSIVHFTGPLHHAKVPTLLTACDVLVYPAPKSNHPFYTRDTSPLKLFEYMAAGKPIVTADLPPVRDVLSESTAFFCIPGDGESMASALRDALVEKEDAKQRAARARALADNHTWMKRMQRILAVLGVQ